MRTIKFRGKRIDNGKWAIGDLRHHNDGSVTIMTNLSVWSDNDDDVDAYGEELRVVPETVGQYAGIKDVHGVDIYEGDILVGHSDKKYIVLFGEEYGSFYTVPIDTHTTREELLLWFRVEYEHTPVIGNCWDNPELLKGGEE